MSISRSDERIEDVSIFFLLNRFLRFDLRAVYNVEPTSLDLRQTNRWVSSDFECWDEDFFAFMNLTLEPCASRPWKQLSVHAPIHRSIVAE